jgi:hypothetical protein
MKFGIENKLTTDSVTITSSVSSVTGEGPNNILTQDTRQAYRVTQGTTELVIEFGAATVVQFIGLFNCTIEDDVVVKTYTTYPGVVTNTKTINISELNGLDSLNGFLLLTDKTAITHISITTNGTTGSFKTSFGYVWAGNLIDLGCAEALQPSDEAYDEGTVTRAGGIAARRKYNARDYSLTTEKEVSLDTLRSNIRNVITTGYATPRPWIVLDGTFLTEEIVLGITDSGRFVYDKFILSKTEINAQTTFKVQEVL